MQQEAAITRRAAPVTVNNLSKKYAENSVLNNVSLAVEAGEIFVIMGPSGAGKSVLLRHIAGLDRAEQGVVEINGKNVAHPSTYRNISIALVFQAGALFNSLSVFDNLAFYPREHGLYDSQTLKRKVFKVLEILNLQDTAHLLPAELSGGMKKRVAIARALVMEPQLLLYDEPTSELDPVTAANITEIIGTLKEEFDVTSIVVSHDRSLALSIGERVALLMDGEIITVQKPEQLKQSTDPKVVEFLNPQINIKNPRFRRG